MRLLVLENNRLISTLKATEARLSIGSGPEAFVHLNDPRVSAHQASIVCEPDGEWWLEILDGNRPTHLNRAVQRGKARLRHADEIEMGAFCIRIFIEHDVTGDALHRERARQLTRNHGGSLPLGTLVIKNNRELHLSKDQLEQMTLLAIRLEQAANVQDLMTPVVRALLRTFSGRRAWIGLRNADHGEVTWSLGWSSKGAPCPRPVFSTNMESRCMTIGHCVCTPKVRIEGVGSAMGAPLASASGIRGMLYVENDPGDEAYDETTLELLNANASCVALPLADHTRRTTAKRQAVSNSEQTVARMIQDALTPETLPQWDRLQVAAYRYPGSTHGCDLYDVLQLRDRCAAILLARLTAQGAALPRLFAEVRTAFRIAVLHGDTPVDFVRSLNWLLRSGRADAVADTVCVWLNPATGEVRFCTVGPHVVVGRIRSDGTCDMVPPTGVPPAGRAKAEGIEPHHVQLDVGQTLLLATDGATTATNAKGETFGLEGLRDSLCDGLGDTPGHVLSEMATDLQDYVSGGDCTDDVTVVLVRRE
ncbi:MAG: SpoIIE family protein phosphatase [Phycisphaerae bacterium]